MSLVGTTIDERYEVRRLLGEGGMGLVYEGRHVGLGRKVAIKVLHAEFREEDHAARRFMQEARIAGSLGHPNICDVTDIGATGDDLPYMVMPLLEGQTLAEAMEESEGGFPVSRAVDVVAQVLSALQPAHEAGIVHRDLKPENIFLTRAGDREDFVKVLDFGISKIVRGESSKLKKLTSTGMVIGTPYYMAPEQACGKQDLDPRVDVYAVGALLYELLTGQTPYQGDNYNEIIIKIVNETPPPPRELSPELPEALEAVVCQALAKARENRYSTVSEFREALLASVEAVEGLDAIPSGHPREGDPSTLSPSEAGDGAPSSEGAASLRDARTGSRSGARSGSGAPAKEPNTLTTAAAELKEADPTVSLPGTAPEKAARPRRWVWILGGAGALALAGLVIGMLAAGDGWGGSEADEAPAPRPAERLAPGPRPAPSPTVTVQFVGLPEGARVVLGGRPVEGGRAQVPRSDWKLSYRVEAPGHVAYEGEVTPDQDRTLNVPLDESPPASSAEADAGAGSETGAGPEDGGVPGGPARTGDGGTPVARPGAGADPDAMSWPTGRAAGMARPGAARPAMARPGRARPGMTRPRRGGWGVIRGRGGTSVRTNYDED